MKALAHHAGIRPLCWFSYCLTSASRLWGFLGPFSSHRLAVAELIQYCMEFKGSSGNALLSLCSASSRSLVYDSVFPAPARYLFFVLVATRIFTDSFIIISLDSCLE